MIVIDACVAVKWFLPEPQSDAADAILAEAYPRIACEHPIVEVGNTLLEAVRSRGITPDHAREALDRLPGLIQLQPIQSLAGRAIEIADAVGCTNHDAPYVAAAERWDATLVTADGRLTRQLPSAGWTSQVRRLGP